MGDERYILDHRDTVDMLGDDLASVAMQRDLGLVEGLQDVVTGLRGRHSVAAPTVSHVLSLLAPRVCITVSLGTGEYCHQGH